MYPRAFRSEILEEPLLFDELATEEYNRIVREGRQAEYAPLVNFVRAEVRKSADACEDDFETSPRGEKGESLFRGFVKKQALRLRQLSNLLGFRDPEVATPSASRSNTPPDPSGDHHSPSEDEADTPEIAKHCSTMNPCITICPYHCSFVDNPKMKKASTTR
uniref:Uncharacterized protein n=1 Tax=Avena sativa TaxID=4498 RepID=A0ACD5WTH2_AVESA